jgi:hypothetical protein
MATAACMAWTTAEGSGTCAAQTCTGNVACMRASAGGNCATWCYTKTIAGYVNLAASCGCPMTTGAGNTTWN